MGVAAAKTTNRRAQRALHALSKHAHFRRLRYPCVRAYTDVRACARVSARERAMEVATVFGAHVYRWCLV